MADLDDGPGDGSDGHDLHREFADSDGARSSMGMAAFLEHVEAIPEFVAYKADLRERLALRAGDVVLDVGCGTGTHVLRIAQEHRGPVIGLDRAAMLARARERTPRAGDVRWVAGDANDLPLEAASVDACLVERVLKYLPHPGEAVAEIVRVLRPGGRVAVFELDYRSMALPGDEAVADRAHELLCRSVPQPRMGRRLPGLLAAAGLADVTSRAVAFVAPWPVHDMIVRDPVRAAVDAGRLDAAPTRRWLDAQRPDALTSVHVGVLSSARRPPVA